MAPFFLINIFWLSIYLFTFKTHFKTKLWEIYSVLRISYSSHYWCFFCLVRKSKTSCVSWENDFDDNKPGNRCSHHYHDDDQASIVRFVAPQQIVCPTSSNQTSQLFLQGFFVVGTRQTGLSHHVYSCPDNLRTNVI
jgi:hypothetical protein